MFLHEFTYHKPTSIKEACALLNQNKNSAALAGGTDLFVEMKKGLRKNDVIVSLNKINELKALGWNGNEFQIGAAVTHNEIKKSKVIQKEFPVLADAASKIGTEQVRNMGTVGGNLCTGASCCDMAPVLIALSADLEITDGNNSRTVSLKDFFLNHKSTQIKHGEILTKIILRKMENGSAVGFEKFGLRDAASISVASSAVCILTDGKKIDDVNVVIGAVAPTPRISGKANAILNNLSLEEIVEGSAKLTEAAQAAVADSLPLDDIRGSAEYRRTIVAVLTKRAILKAVNDAINSNKK